MIRLFDILLSVFGLLAALPLLILFAILGLFDTGSPFFLQKRVGREKKPFTLVKLRTMKVGTKSVASHVVGGNQITSFGRFLRKSKMDELPQLWNVLKGEMSLVGPRPCLFCQKDLIEERDRLGIFDFPPGITGLGQIQNVDMSAPQKLTNLESQMLKDFTPRSYFYYIFATVAGKGRGDAVKG
jgi:lipopolysaccharide/colanic/teichoic acid biosynthesis glycosyltransferase